MEHPKNVRIHGQWLPVTPAKPIPVKSPQPILSPNWLESLDVNGANNGQMGALEFDNDGLAQMSYRSLLAINDPMIVSQMNLANVTPAHSGGRVGGSQRMNPRLFNGRIMKPSNRGGVNNQVLPSDRRDINDLLLRSNQGDINDQFVRSNQGGVYNQSPPLNRGDVSRPCTQLTHEDVSRPCTQLTQEEINKQSMQTNYALAHGRVRHPLAPKPQYKSLVPLIPNLNSLPEDNMTSILLSETMASPRTPATVEKNKKERIHNHLPHEIIDLDSEETSTYHFGKLPQSIANKPMEKYFSSRVEPSQVVPSEYQESGRDVAVNSSGELCAQQNPVVTTSEERGLQQTEGENQGIDLNKSPQQKPKRKKHRPKVIREGNPARTPKTATPKPPSTAKNPSEKRKYVRKNTKEVNPQEKPSTTLEDAIDPNSQSGSKPVRRTLDFDLEDSQARDGRLSASGPMAFGQNVYDTQGQGAPAAAETVVTSNTAPAVHSPQGQYNMVSESSMGGGVGFDLNNSKNQFIDETLRIPQTPIQSRQPSRQEMWKAKYRDDFARMMNSMTPSLQPTRREGGNLQSLARMINCQNIQGNHERHLKDRSPSQNKPLQGTKRDYNLVGNSQVQSNGSSMHANNGAGRVNDNLNDIHKKRRFETLFTWACTPNGWEFVPSMQNTNEPFTFADAQRLALEKMQLSERMLLLNQLAPRANGQHVQVQSQTSQGNIVDNNKVSTPNQVCYQPSTPEKSPICSNGYEKDKVCGPIARMEVLIANQTKSKTSRQKKKEDPHVQSLATNVNQMKQAATACKIGSSPIVGSEAQCSTRKYKSSPILVSDGGYLIEDLVQKLRHLNINYSHGHGVTAQPQNVIVPYVGGGGTMVPFEGPFELLKKRKPRPKVDLDPESNRVWKLLMGKETEGEGGTDVDKEKWWEEERRVFRGRAESFIARMHLIQGDRHFSRWKGSVVDSVIGVFLTQNVSDHLSSSAFMSLAARFPQKSKENNKNAYVETIQSPIIMSEPDFCDQSSLGMNKTKEMNKIKESLDRNIDFSKESSLDFHEMGQKSPDSVLGTTVIATSCASAVESEDRRFHEDVVSSQNYVDSSKNSSECPGQTTLLKFEADELLNGGRVYGFNSFTELLQMANDTVLQDPKVVNNGRVSLEEYSDGIDWSPLYSSNAHFNLSSAPYSYDHSNDLYSRFESMGHGSAIINECNQSYLSQSASELNETSINGSSTSAMDQNKLLTSKIAPRVDSCQPISKNTVLHSDKHSCGQNEALFQKNISSLCLNQQDGNAIMFQQRGRGSDVQTERSRKPVAAPQTRSTSHNGNQRNNFVFIGAAESNLRNEVRTSQKVSGETSNNVLMAKKVKAETDKKTTFDWDSLRKEAYRCGAKREWSSHAMDSLEYEAVRQADVSIISDTIRERGMNNMLAERIKDFLNRLVKDHGSIDLEWLRDVPPDKAKDYLLSIRGLGLKSVECVRLLTLHHLAFPVDTNVGRICVRLGWVPLQPLPESLQLHLLEMYPMLETIQKYLWPRLCKLDQPTLYELHYQLITFGKVFCTKSKPNCNSCPMRGECKHFASAYASARLALPGPEERRIVRSSVPLSCENACRPVPGTMLLPQLEGNTFSQEQTVPRHCEPIIEEPATPEPECIEPSIIDIEDAFYDDPDEIPSIQLNFKEFTQNLQNYMQENNMSLQDCDISKALVAVSPEAASIPMPKLKNVNRLRTEHLVYELPDSHPLVRELDKREPDDPCPYLLAIWTPGETALSTEAPKSCCNSQDFGKSCDKSTCFSCNSIREAQAQTVRGTILIPCRTANRGSFPLNGTYFQVNEIMLLAVTQLMFLGIGYGTCRDELCISDPPYHQFLKALQPKGYNIAFGEGFVCVRGFDRTMRAPKPLFARLHFPASKVTRNRTPAATAREEE